MSTRGRPPKLGTSFDRLIKQQSQKGRFGIGGSKSSGIAVGKWGSTSYTSLKKPNGFSSQKDQAVTLQSSNTDSGIGVARKREWTNSEMPQSLSSSSVANSVPRPKKFFKSRDTSSKPSEQPQQVNTENISEKPRVEAGIKTFQPRKNVEISTETNAVGHDSMTKNTSSKRNKHAKELSPVLASNQLQQLEDTHTKKSSKKFFTSKQRKQEHNLDNCNAIQGDNVQPDIVEDRENMPRVPPLKLRLKAAHAALSMDSFTNSGGSNLGQFTQNNNKKEISEISDTPNSVEEARDTQPTTLSNQSDPDMTHKLRIDDITEKTESEITAKESTKPRRGRKPNVNHNQTSLENSIRCKNGIEEHSDYTKDADVTDVAGGTRHHRKNMLAALPLDEDKYADKASNPPKDSTARSTRSSRLRGSTRGAVDYNEEKSDEYMDAVCERQQPLQLAAIAENDSDTLKEDDSITTENNEANDIQEPFNANSSKSEAIVSQPSTHTKEQGDRVSQLSKKDWNNDDIDQFYTKVSDEGVKESLNDSCKRQMTMPIENDSTDATTRTYTRKRKERQLGINEKKSQVPNSDTVGNLVSQENDFGKKCLDERIPNQDDITKMAATTSNTVNDISSAENISVLNSQDNIKSTESYISVSSSRQSGGFSIKELADIKEDEETKNPYFGSNDSTRESDKSNLEKINSMPLHQNNESKNTEDDSDFYSKLIDNKNQINQKAPVKSFSLGNKQSSTQSTTSTTTGSNIIKKRSIFKSKALTSSTSTGVSGNGNQASQGSKGRSLYKHKFGANDEETPKEPTFRTQVLQRALTMPSTSSLDFDDNDFGENTNEKPFSSNRLVRVPTVTGGSASGSIPGFDETIQEVVSVKCPKAEKTYYQVIKKTKKAHQIQDSGEFQEFNDDVEYIQEGLGRHNNLSTRCLSTVTLASKCMEPPFRMHLRAHGTVTTFFQELKDAPDNPSLALCTSTVLFVLSQDRLNMDLDRESLELMLNLLDTDSRIKDALDGAGLSKRELEKNKSKVQELVAAMKAKGRATNLSLDHISADHLAMETLLSMTSKRAGEWFKEELRELGGLDHLVRTMSDCLAFLTADDISMWTDPLHNKLKKSDRVLKVLESVTHENEENCQYLLEYQGGKFLDCIHSFFKLLDEEVPLNSSVSTLNEKQIIDKEDKESVAFTLRESLLDVIRVYINLVHDYKSIPHGSRLSGEKEDIFDICLHGMFVLPSYIHEEKRFDVLVLILTLVINLVENCKPNRALLMKTFIPDKSDDMFTTKERQIAPEGLIKMFLEREENAKRLETKTDKILDGKGDEEETNLKPSQENSEITGDKKPEKAECEDENLVVKRNPSDAHASYGSKNKSKPGGNAKNNKPDAKDSQKSHEEFIDETVKKLLEKAGSHMEDTLVASYLTLIIGYLIHEDEENEKIVRQWLPENNFSQMVAVLKKFYNFMNLTASASVTSTRGLKATEMILKYMEKVDKPPEEKKEDDLKVSRSSIDIQEETFDDLTLFDVTKDEDEDLDDLSHTGSRSDRSRNSESSFLDMKSPNFDDFGKL